jgi:transcriptional regulator with GAF, ATPase, and Fis domain
MAGRRCRPPGRCSITWPPALPSIPRCARCREDERVLEALAAQTAVALDNARAWDEVRRLEQRLAAENLYLREEVQLAHDVTGIVGDSEGMRSVLA